MVMNFHKDCLLRTSISIIILITITIYHDYYVLPLAACTIDFVIALLIIDPGGSMTNQCQIIYLLILNNNITITTDAACPISSRERPTAIRIGWRLPLGSRIRSPAWLDS
jgi:hypothetical protein